MALTILGSAAGGGVGAWVLRRWSSRNSGPLPSLPGPLEERPKDLLLDPLAEIERRSSVILETRLGICAEPGDRESLDSLAAETRALEAFFYANESRLHPPAADIAKRYLMALWAGISHLRNAQAKVIVAEKQRGEWAGLAKVAESTGIREEMVACFRETRGVGIDLEALREFEDLMARVYAVREPVIPLEDMPDATLFGAAAGKLSAYFHANESRFDEATAKLLSEFVEPTERLASAAQFLRNFANHDVFVERALNDLSTLGDKRREIVARFRALRARSPTLSAS